MITYTISSEDLIASLSQRIDEVLRQLIPVGATCALLDFPDHPNSGDSAIWLGETIWLGKNKNKVIYTCDKDTYASSVLADLIGDGLILLHGGGNFGDIWYEHQRFREQVIKDFPENKIIQFSQTVYFESDRNLSITRQILNNHSDFTLLCRDNKSLDLAQKEFRVPSILCPDMAFSIGSINKPLTPTVDVVCLARSDKETANTLATTSDKNILRTDWLSEATTELAESYLNISQKISVGDRTNSDHAALYRIANGLAEQRFVRGCKILSQGKLVITDRLHAHILSLLMGTPNIVLDNNYGKIKGFYDTWTTKNRISRWARNMEELETVLSDTDFSEIVKSVGIQSSTIAGFKQTLKDAMEIEKKEKLLWLNLLEKAIQEIEKFVSAEKTFILIDDEQIRYEIKDTLNRVIPFSKDNERYYGPPANDDFAIQELEGLREAGAFNLVIAWPSFWWLSYYKDWDKYLRSNFPCLLENERLIVFDRHL